MTRQMPYEPLPASVLLNEFDSLKRFAVRGMCIFLGRGLRGGGGMWWGDGPMKKHESP